MAFLQTQDGTRLFYNDWGTGKAVVFVHGWSISSDSWEYVMNDLPHRGVRCIAYDARGCGRSDQPWNGYDYDTLADDLAAVLEHLDLHEVTLVGHSMGCGVIVRYLTNHDKERVTGVVLVGTTTPFPLKTADNPDGIEKRYFDAMVEAIQADRAGYVSSLAPGFLDDAGSVVSPELMQWAIGLTLQASPRAAVGMLRANSETDQREELKRITVPTLFLHGDRDQSCPLETTAKRSHGLLPCSALKIYEGRAHGFYITDAKRLSDDVFDFMNGAFAPEGVNA